MTAERYRIIGTDSRFRGLEEYLNANPISNSFHSIVNATPGGSLKHVYNIQLKQFQLSKKMKIQHLNPFILFLQASVILHPKSIIPWH